jgi:hypothetical protein
MHRTLNLLIVAAGCPTVLMAYTDPGTGMLVWQSILAVSVGFLFTTRRLLARVFKRNQ